MPWTIETKARAKGKDHAKWLTAGELAKFLGVHKVTVLAWIKEGQIVPEAMTINGRWHLFSPDQVSKILDQRNEELKRRERNAERRRRREGN